MIHAWHPRRVRCLLVGGAGVLAIAGCREKPGAAPVPVPSSEVMVEGVGGSGADVIPEPLPEGLTVEVLDEGEGPACPPGATVTVEYVAMLSGGEVWDSTERRRRPMTWDLASPNLIEGLRRGVPGMRPGGRRLVRIPSALAYGRTGRPPIPPDEDLSFEITLLKWE